MTPAAGPPPGWYPCPFGDPAWFRWFDGRAWSAEHVRRRVPAAPVPAVPREYRVIYRPPNHGFHAAMSILTIGLWVPVWMFNAGGRYRIREGARRRP